MSGRTDYLAVLNPAAGGGRCTKLAPAVLDRLERAGIAVETVETRAPGQGTEIVRRAWETGRRNFIAMGGDGTVHEIVNGLFSPSEQLGEARPCLALLPMGTGNSFLREFTDRGTEHAIEAIIEGKKRPCDVVRFEHTGGAGYFINIFSVGFAAEVGALRNRRFSALGRHGYTLGVLVKLVNLSARVFPLRLDRGEVRADPVTFIALCNSKFTGGNMMMAPGADAADGLVDVVFVGPLGRAALLRTFPRIFKGTHVSHPAVAVERAGIVDFNLDRKVDVLIDGEIFHLQPTRVQVLAGALDVQV